MKISGKEYQRFSKQIILKKFGIVGQKNKELKSSCVGYGWSRVSSVNLFS